MHILCNPFLFVLLALQPGFFGCCITALSLDSFFLFAPIFVRLRTTSRWLRAKCSSLLWWLQVLGALLCAFHTGSISFKRWGQCLSNKMANHCID